MDLRGLSRGFHFFLGGGGSGTFLLNIIICIESGTLLGNIWGGVADFFFFWGGGGDSPQNRPPGSPVCISISGVFLTLILEGGQ